MVRWVDTVMVKQNVDFNNLVEKVNELKAIRRQRRIPIWKRLIMKKEILHVHRSTKRLRQQSVQAQANYLQHLKAQRCADMELRNSTSRGVRKCGNERRAKVARIWVCLGKNETKFYRATSPLLV